MAKTSVTKGLSGFPLVLGAALAVFVSLASPPEARSDECWAKCESFVWSISHRDAPEEVSGPDPAPVDYVDGVQMKVGYKSDDWTGKTWSPACYCEASRHKRTATYAHKYRTIWGPAVSDDANKMAYLKDKVEDGGWPGDYYVKACIRMDGSKIADGACPPPPAPQVAAGVPAPAPALPECLKLCTDLVGANKAGEGPVNAITIKIKSDGDACSCSKTLKNGFLRGGCVFRDANLGSVAPASCPIKTAGLSDADAAKLNASWNSYQQQLACLRHLNSAAAKDQPGELTLDNDVGAGGAKGPVIVTAAPAKPSPEPKSGLYVQTSRGGLRFRYPSPKDQEACGNKLYYSLEQHADSCLDQRKPCVVTQTNYFSVNFVNDDGEPVDPPTVTKQTSDEMKAARNAKTAPASCFSTLDDNRGASWDKDDQTVMHAQLARIFSGVQGKQKAGTIDAAFCKNTKSACLGILASDGFPALFKSVCDKSGPQVDDDGASSGTAGGANNADKPKDGSN